MYATNYFRLVFCKMSARLLAKPYLAMGRCFLLNVSFTFCGPQSGVTRNMNAHVHCEHTRANLHLVESFRVPQRLCLIYWKQTPGPRLNIKTVFPGLGFHYKVKTVVRPFYLYNGNSYAGKTASLYWDGPQIGLTRFFYKWYLTYKQYILLTTRISSFSDFVLLKGQCSLIDPTQHVWRSPQQTAQNLQ